MIIEKWLKKSIIGGIFRFFPVALLASIVDAALLLGIRSFMKILSHESMFNLWEWLALMILLSALRFIFLFWKVRISEGWVYRASAGIMGWFLCTLRNLSPRCFHNSDGDRMVESAYESTQVLQANGSVFFQAVQAVLQLVVFLPVLFYISWPLALFLFIVVVPLISWIQRKLQRLGPEEESLLESRANFRGDLNLARRLFKQWSSRFERSAVSSGLLRSLRNLRNRGLASAVRKGGLSLVTETVSVLAMVVVLSFCALLITEGWMDGTGLVLFCSAVLLCYKPVKECARVMPQMRSAMSAYNILKKFGKMPKRMPVETRHEEPFSETEVSAGEICVRAGSFKYEGSDAFVYDDYSFKWTAEKPILVRGRNGVGKSTLLRLIAGLEQWQMAGEISCSKKFRKNVFFVAQDLELPPRNLLRSLLSEILMMPKGKIVDDFVCKSGTRNLLDKECLSGGERARVALVWALAADSSMLLLDEPFASVALADREMLLESFLDAACALGKWVVVVSHDEFSPGIMQRLKLVEFS